MAGARRTDTNAVPGPRARNDNPTLRRPGSRRCPWGPPFLLRSPLWAFEMGPWGTLLSTGAARLRGFVPTGASVNFSLPDDSGGCRDLNCQWWRPSPRTKLRDKPSFRGPQRRGSSTPRSAPLTRQPTPGGAAVSLSDPSSFLAPGRALRSWGGWVSAGPRAQLGQTPSRPQAWQGRMTGWLGPVSGGSRPRLLLCCSCCSKEGRSQTHLIGNAEKQILSASGMG